MLSGVPKAAPLLHLNAHSRKLDGPGGKMQNQADPSCPASAEFALELFEA